MKNCHAAAVGNTSVTCQEAHQQLGQDGGAVVGLQAGQVTEEEVHWGVEMLISHHQHEDENVPHHCHHVDHQEEQEEVF